MSKLTIELGGRNVVVGEVYEDKLPKCKVCDEPIPLQRIIRSLAVGHPAPQYDTPRCANVAANRDRHERNREKLRQQAEKQATAATKKQRAKTPKA